MLKVQRNSAVRFKKAKDFLKSNSIKFKSTNCKSVVIYTAYTCLNKRLERLENEYIDLEKRILVKDIFSMNKIQLEEFCKQRGLDDVECKIAYYLVIEKLKGKELYDAIGYSESQTKRKRKHIMEVLKSYL